MEASVAKKSADVVLKICTEIEQRNIKIKDERTLTRTILHQMVKAVLDSVQIIIEDKNVEVETHPEEYVNPVILDLVQETSYELVSSLDKISYVLLRQQLAGDTYKDINSTGAKIFSWVKVDKPSDLSNLTSTLTNFPLSISQDMASSVERLTEELGVQFILLKINPFWWAKDNIDTYILSVMFCYKQDLRSCRYVSILRFPVKLNFNITAPVSSAVPINGMISQLDTEMSEDDLDLGIIVYRLDPPPRARLFFTFVFENGDSSAFRVLILLNLRPTYEMMMENGVEISQKSPVYNLPYDKSDSDKIYFMGILPGKEQPVNTTSKLKFTTYYTLCRTWLRWQWTELGCWVGNETTANNLVCECSHLSLFAGTVQVPENDLNTFEQFPLFLTSRDNIVPLIVLLIFLLLYLLLCLWGRYKDKKDSVKGDVIVMEDNFPGESFGYLLGVYTGSRINSGTDAHVGIRLFGDSKLQSRAHILMSSSRDTLEGNSDDWFLLYCPQHLGQLESLQTWHDNCGSSPDWFVERIYVYDLEEKTQYLFELNMWIAMNMEEYPEAVAVPVRVNEFFSVKSVFLSNIVTGLRDTHYWTSILWRHPRNAVTRLERVQVLMCFIMVAMLVSLLLFCFAYRIYLPYPEDDPSFAFTDADIYIFFISFLAACFTACLVMFLFRKSYTHNYIRTKNTMFLRSEKSKEVGTQPGLEDAKMSMAPEKRTGTLKKSSVSTITSLSRNRSRYKELTDKDLNENFIRYGIRTTAPKERTTCENFALALHSIVRGTSLTPVKLPNFESGLVLHKKYYYAAWILCIAIIVLCAIPVAIIGWKLPHMKNEKWLFIFFAILLFDIFIVSTFKILLFSAILGFVFQRMVLSTAHNVNAKDGTQEHLVGDKDHLDKLVETRCSPWYWPLSVDMREEFRQKRVRRMRRGTVIDFLVVLLLLLVLVMLCYIFAADLYPANRHAKRMLTTGHRHDIAFFEQVFNRTNFENFLQFNFLSQIYRYMWYNLSPLVDLSDSEQSRRKDFADDCVSRLLGNARIRQLRVMLGACPEIKYFKNMTKDCSPPWSSGHEDIDVYNIRWLMGGYKDVARKSTAWRYTDPHHSNSSRFYGRSATLYNSGGYIADLGYSKHETRYILSNLVKNLWLDHLTRAAFLQMTIYNVNTGLFSQVVLVVEQTPEGEYLTRSKVDSVTTDISMNLWNISFVVFQLFFLVRMCVLMNRNGIFVYFSKAVNIFEGFLLALGFCTVVLYFIHIKSSTFYVQEFQRSGYDSFFNFYNIIEYSKLAQLMMCVLFFCMVVRLLVSWKFGRTFISFYYTFVLSWPWIVWLTWFLIFYIFITWRFVGYSINNFIYPCFTTVIVFYKDNIIGNHLTTMHKVLVYLICMLSLFVNLAFIASFAYFYKIAKKYRFTESDNFNMATFVRDEIKCCRRKKNK